jgi:2-polyprenyl-6-methoxyphenol hydroxylase-like FAD-dependent oxidoreductase
MVKTPLTIDTTPPPPRIGRSYLNTSFSTLTTMSNAQVPAVTAIIGAGLSGLCLALALHQQSLPCTVYESRAAPLNIGGAVMLSPNALRVLDALGIYSAVKTQGYSFDMLHFRDLAGDLTETYEFGSQAKYGYPALRIYRHVLIDALLAALRERRVAVEYGRKFSHVVAETDADGVTFAFADGSTAEAGRLVGADGIHSTVRKYLYPDLETRFLGMAGMTAAVPTAQLRLPTDLHLPVTFVSPRHGAFVIAPQGPDGSEVLIGRQKRIPLDVSREELAALASDTDAHVAFLREGAEAFPDVVRNAVSSIPTDKLNVWPFYVVPRLERWASEKRRVVILGDAAHAIPPSAGQGVNQAFEDVYMLALLLSVGTKVDEREALGFWQRYRQGRVDRILKLNEQIDLRRMPAAQEGGKVATEPFELGWLYKPDFKGVVKSWVKENGKE